MSHKHFALYHHSVLIRLDCLSVVIHRNSREAYVCAKHFLCLNNNIIFDEDFVSVKY